MKANPKLEKYKPIPGYDGKYIVSSWGYVYSAGCQYSMMEQVTEKVYFRVALYKNGKRKWHKVHRLVAKAFIPNPENKPQVNHIDGNKINNSVTNLEWVTDEENKAHRKGLLDE